MIEATMKTPVPASEDPVFGLVARFVSGMERNKVDTVWYDEVLALVAAAAGQPARNPSRLGHFGFVDDAGVITKHGRTFLRTNALPILDVVTKAVLRNG